MTDAITADDVRALLEDILDEELPPFTAATTAKDVEHWDSLNHVRLLLAIERVYGIEIPVQDVEGLANVGDMVRLINTLRTG